MTMTMTMTMTMREKSRVSEGKLRASYAKKMFKKKRKKCGFVLVCQKNKKKYGAQPLARTRR